jgi:CrcB protein
MTDGWLLLAVPVAGGMGSVARYAVDEAVRGWRGGGEHFPLGIFVVNVTASLLAGLVAGAAVGHAAGLLLAGGFLGGYSTFSTWIVDSVAATEQRRAQIGVANVVASLVFGLLAAAAGFYLAGG